MFTFLHHLYDLIVFNPLYNGLMTLMDIFPWMDIGIAVIVFTILVRLILFPLSKKAIVTQVRMKEIQPEIDRIRSELKDNREAQALKTMQLYRDKKVSPFSSILVLIIQIPIIIGLYSIFIRSGLPVVNTSLLYSFVHAPTINMHLFGIFDISQKSIVLAVIAAIAQFFQLQFSLANATVPNGPSTPQADAAKSVTKTMKYIFPVMIFLISYRFSGVVAIYWTVSSLFTLGQELVVRRHLKKHQPL